MNITRDVIIDLYPLYAEQECSADTKALVEDYLQKNPQHADELRRLMRAPLPKFAPAPNLEEIRALREARRRVRWRATVMGLAIFFSLAPFSFTANAEGSHWLFMQSPGAACAYGSVGVVLWISYAILRIRSKSV
jgi:ferric-dicitrate binding protein FerR (iron transport regulator)